MTGTECNSNRINADIFLRKYYVLETESEEDDRTPKYEMFFWFLDYTKLFLTRLAKDLMISMLSYVYSGQLLPEHTIDLMHTQKILQAERELVTATYSSGIISQLMKDNKSDVDFHTQDKFMIGPQSSIVDLTKFFYNPIQDTKYELEKLIMGSSPKKKLTTSDVELERKIQVNNTSNVVSTSTSISIQENKDNSIISDISANKLLSSRIHGTHNLHTEVIDSLLRSELNMKLKIALEFLHRDNDFLIAAEIGDHILLEEYIEQGEDIQQMDHLGRNALHLAVCSENEQAITLLLDAGVNPNLKDNVGMTPLSLNLMRSPSLRIATLLFDHGAQILPRVDPTDTGLFLQFLMMCYPTEEEEKIITLLIDKGSVINDPEAPGGRQALHFAAMSNNCKLINLLVDLGADLHMTNHRYETPLEVAYTFKCREAIQCLSALDYDCAHASSLKLIESV